MADLTPAAQAVLDAAEPCVAPNECPGLEAAIAAALRVVADEGESFYDPCEGKTSAVRTDWILAIADELENHQ